MNERAHATAVGLVSAAVAVVFVAQASGRLNDAEPIMMSLLSVMAGLYAIRVKRRIPPTPPEALTLRRDFLERRMWLEAEHGIDHDPDEVDELARLDAELAALEPPEPTPFVPPTMALDAFPAVPVVNVGSPGHPVDPYGFPLDPLDLRPEDVDRIFGFPVDHDTNTVAVPAAHLERIQRFLDARDIAIRARVDQADFERVARGLVFPTEVEVVELRDGAGNIEPLLTVNGPMTQREADELRALWKATHTRHVHDDATCTAWCSSYHRTNPRHHTNRCTCADHVGRGVPACPVHHYS